MGFVYFVIRIVWSCPFLMSLMKLSSYMLPCFTKICVISSLSKYPPCWSFKLDNSNQIKVDIKLRAELAWNADLWLNLSKTACATLSPIHMVNQIAKLNSWKLIVARSTLHQHNLNAISTYLKYLIWQFNLTGEWDLILQLATLWVTERLIIM